MDISAQITRVAVLTGDVVSSTDLSRAVRARLPTMLRRAYAGFQSRHSAALPFDLSIYSGDSWQIYVEAPEIALPLAVAMRASIREQLDADTRCVIAIDEVDFVRPSAISESDGPAFRRSGRALVNIDRTERLRLVMPEYTEGETVIQLAADGIADLLDTVAQGWTRSQAQAIAHMLRSYPEEPRQVDVAAAWQPRAISQPAVNRHLRSARWEYVRRALTRYQKLLRVLKEG